MKRLSLALVAAAALTSSGCSTIFHRPHFVRIRPVSTPTATADLGEPRKAARSAYYQSAVRAIGARDYALALDLLQTARSQDPNDPAVINAFGVVYDKLGRFDLSARYYAQAAALDPDSPIVRQNLAYSAVLQGRALPNAPTAQTQLAEVAPSPTFAQVAAALLAPTSTAFVPHRAQTASPAAPKPELLGGPPAVRPQPAPTPAPQQAQAQLTAAKPTFTIAKAPAPTVVLAVAPNGALLTGRSLQIVDASGATGGGEGVRQQLASRGWSAPKSAVTVAKAQTRTRIVYPQGGQAIAQALARTLPFPVEVAACDDRCTSLSLIVGEDAAHHLRARS
ncbi:MAG TPA: LytR C-terminal domain-containing protein [Caulobacteraceae bacterium]|nr:LytR C-terminal domain-containing protein [Caulobacteraceae bacterium]